MPWLRTAAADHAETLELPRPGSQPTLGKDRQQRGWGETPSLTRIARTRRGNRNLWERERIAPHTPDSSSSVRIQEGRPRGRRETLLHPRGFHFAEEPTTTRIAFDRHTRRLGRVASRASLEGRPCIATSESAANVRQKSAKGRQVRTNPPLSQQPEVCITRRARHDSSVQRIPRVTTERAGQTSVRPAPTPPCSTASVRSSAFINN